MSKFKFNKTLAAGAVSLALIGLSSAPAFAGNTSGKGFLQGVAKSETGSVASGVMVKVRNKTTGLTRSVSTNSDGQYRFPLLPTGTYEIVTTSAQFETLTETVDVHIGDKTLINLTLTLQGNTVTVVGTAISAIDTTSSEQNYVFSSEDIKRMPVGRNLTSVALLAPGVVQGDTAFGNLPSFGGSSVAENIYVVNGLNITSHRDGLALSNVPFEFYDTINVKTGGWSAEYGRALGGAIIASTKKGSNEFEAGGNAYMIDDSMSAHLSNIDSNDGSGLWSNVKDDTSSTTNFNLWAGGALIKDKLFAFGLINPRVTRSQNIGNTSYAATDRTDIFYGLTLDYYITDNHIIDLTAFGDSRDYQVDTGRIDNGIKTFTGPYNRVIGGNNFAINYTGIMTDDVTVSLMYGQNRFKNSAAVDMNFDLPCAFDRFTGQNYSGYVLCTNNNQDDKRSQFRADIDWYVGDHTLRFGVDAEVLEANENTVRSGGAVYRYQPGYVRIGYYNNDGSFKTNDSAIYFEDTWEVTEDLTLKLGVRNDAFANKNASGDKFVDIKNQIAPRLGVSWDPMGNGEDKVFGSFGRYYLGVATNTNVRLAGSELFTRQYFTTDGPDSNGLPTGTVVPVTNLTVYGDGQQRSTDEAVNADLNPMYEDELILGYQKEMGDWVAGMKWTYRDLGESLEDIAIDAGFDAFLADQGETCGNCSGFHYYVLTNPGAGDTTITTDPNGGSNPQTYTIPNSYLGYPKAQRTYKAWDLSVSHPWDEDFAITIDYTWSHSEGNNEGWVRSDNGQTDAGLTTNFDQPGLTDYAFGDLPNDRRHQLKIFGTKALTDNMTAGFSFRYQTGRPTNKFGYHPTDVFASYYGSSSFAGANPLDSDGFYTGSTFVPRGTAGRTPETYQLDLNLTYNTDMFGGEGYVSVDVFNVLNTDTTTQINEVADKFLVEDAADPDQFSTPVQNGIDRGQVDPNYGLTTARQTPRYVRLSVGWKF